MLTIGTLLLFQSLGVPEIVLIVLLVVFLFGGKKIPELARGLGRGIREFKDASKEVKKEINDSLEEDKKA
ncbi:MAG: twin-arginine translocase TatA/TatE family subunit [Cytophagaceae bacterium]